MLGAGVEGFGELLQGFHFDLDEYVVATNGAGLFQRGGDSAGGHDVVFLDQDSVIEPEAMVLAAAAGDGVLLRQPQAGQGLAGVDDARAGAGDGIDMKPRHRGGGREQLQEVQRRAFGGEQGAGAGLDLADHFAGLDRVAVAQVPADLGQRVEPAKAGVEPCSAGQHGVFAADDGAQRSLVGGAEQCRQIAAADVFGQGGEHVSLHFGSELKREFHDALRRLGDAGILPFSASAVSIRAG